MDSVIVDTGKIIMNGNSCAVRLPATMMKAARLVVGAPVEIMATVDGITIKPRRERAKAYDLASLVAGITEQNLHREADFGGPVGKELL